MAAVPGFTTYEQIGQAEDVQDDIYMISPTDNPVAAMSRNIAATGRYHEWQEDTLAAIKKNANPEGNPAGDDTSEPTVMKGAYCQIFYDVAEISRTAERVKKYGRASEMAFQVMKRKLGMIRDEESAIAGDAGGDGRQTGSAGDNTTPAGRELTSIYSQVDTGNIKFATDTQLVGGVAITTIPELETVLLSAAQSQFDAGGMADYMITDSATVGYFPSFALSAGRTRDVTGTELIHAVDIYQCQYGRFDVVTDRSMTNTSQAILIVDFEYSATPILDPTQDNALAKVGDSDRREVVRESTYALLNSKAAAIVDAIPATLAAS